MGKCKHETSNGRCGLKESYAYRHKCYTEECCKCHESIEPCGRHEQMTNADIIRSTDDELEAMLLAVKLGYKQWCDHHCENECDDGCNNCIREWLKQPAEEGADHG